MKVRTLPSEGKYEAPKDWSFMQVRDYLDINDTSRVYMRRIKIIDTPWFGIYIHFLLHPDGASYPLHDHPWDFVSIILDGDYTEQVPVGKIEFGPGMDSFGVRWKYWKRWSIHKMKATDIHKITRLGKSPTTTLLLRGPIKRKWGFYTIGGWIESSKYFEEYWPDHDKDSG